ESFFLMGLRRVLIKLNTRQKLSIYYEPNFAFNN
ncbi:unnamed protein product, partial [marine sediment metagenome]